MKRSLAAFRLVTLVGVGGVGKTRLALRSAAEIQRAFDEGVWLVELDRLHDPALVAHTVAVALGLREQPGQPTVASLTEYLAPRRLLLVLDNCEHLVESCAELAEAVLQAAPEVRVLATSREPLGVRGEATQLVPSLTVPDPRQPHSWSELSAYEAVALFADRAAAVLSGFEVDRGNQDAVVEICDRLDGLPLAIELAAVRLRALSPQQLAQRLDDRYRLLATELRGAPTRQQTLRSCIEWSYDLCSATERRLWARAAVFAGGFELDAAEEICAGAGLAPEDLLDVVTALVGKSILIREEHRGVVRYRLLAAELRGAPTRQQTLRSCIEWSYDLCSSTERRLWARAAVFAGGFELDAAEEICAGAGLAPGDLLDVVTALVGKSILIREEHRGVVRYRLLETMREFGQDKLRAAGELSDLRQRHMRWYEQLVRQAETDWVSPRQGAWFARLDREHANVQVALDHCLAEPAQVEPALRILVAVFHFYWWGRSRGREGRHWLGQALSLPAQPSALRAMALLVESSLALADGDVGPAGLCTDEGCALATKLGDAEARGFCFFDRGSAALYSGDIQGAMALCEEGLSGLEPGTHLAVRLNLLLILAIATGLAGEEQRATALHKEMLAITEPVGECFHRAYALWALGLLALRQGELDRAADLQQQSLRLRRRLQELTGSGWSLESLAW
ncbi:MAG TPA: NB-ARC domain-containing protein, partial [Streptosporangiaceae bacterium]|nr:NB-ARC domain-containing protein [Streptosporangiaceae bacterium]